MTFRESYKAMSRHSALNAWWAALSLSDATTVAMFVQADSSLVNTVQERTWLSPLEVAFDRACQSLLSGQELPVLRYLVRSGANPLAHGRSTSPTVSRGSVLMQALNLKDSKIAKVMIEAHTFSKRSCRESLGNTLALVVENHPDLLPLFVGKGVDLNQGVGGGTSVVMHALRRKNVDALKVLLNLGQTLKESELQQHGWFESVFTGKIQAQQAQQAGFQENRLALLDALLMHQVPSEHERATLVVRAITKWADEPTVIWLHEHGFKVNVWALSAAACHHPALVAPLLRMGIDPNANMDEVLTSNPSMPLKTYSPPLAEALRANHGEAVDVLLRAGATATCDALSEDPFVLTLLEPVLRKKVPLDRQNVARCKVWERLEAFRIPLSVERRSTLLPIAVHGGASIPMLKRLVSLGADPQGRWNGLNALDLAIDHNDEDVIPMVDMLLTWGLDPEELSLNNASRHVMPRSPLMRVQDGDVGEKSRHVLKAMEMVLLSRRAHAGPWASALDHEQPRIRL